MNIQCIQDLNSFLHDTYPTEDREFAIIPELCPPELPGDITVNCFRLARICKDNPIRIAERVTTHLKDHPDVDKVDRVKAFVNIGLKNHGLFRDTIARLQEVLGQPLIPQSNRKRILIEFSAPNTNKPQHLGHLRNNALGSAICSILQRVGHEVIAVNLINDRGIHICKSMIAYQRFGGDCTPATVGKKGDHMVGDFYVKFEEEFQRQVSELGLTDAEREQLSQDELFQKTEIGKATQEMLRDWERGDPDTLALWRKLNGWVLEGFDQTYREMGINFDHTYYESNTYKVGRELIIAHSQQGVFYKRSDGATEIDLNNNNLGNKVVLRKDGTAVYVTQDIGTTFLKHEDFKPDEMIWIVGDEQIHHFKVLFAILRRMGYPWADCLVHIPYGMVHLPTGKMKSREGKVVDADELFADMMELARTATLERCDENIPDDLNNRASMIYMGALKFMLLKVNPKTTISFDPSASIKFEGDTGPYVQYAYARIASILRKTDPNELSMPPNWSPLGQPEERLLALRCGLYPSVLLKAAQELDTSMIAGYLLDLTKDFNKFYKKHSVLSSPSSELRRARLNLCVKVQGILKDGLNVLNIDTLEAM